MPGALGGSFEVAAELVGLLEVLLHQVPGNPGGWIRGQKTRRVSQFSLADGRAVTGATPQAGQPACSVELAEARAARPGGPIGFEATGPAQTLRTHLEATAALVFTRPLLGRAELGPANSYSYAEWLIRAANLGSTPEPENVRSP